MLNLNDILVRRCDSIRSVMAAIERGAKGIALVVDPSRRLEATVTDGDLRRAILGGASLEDRVAALPALASRRRPVTAPLESSREQQLALMRRARVRQLPLLDAQGRVVDLTTSDDLASERLPVQAVIMAGGFGTRLRPLTDITPKPMLEIDGQPLLERTIESLRRFGIRRISITTHYLPEKITSHFGDGSRYGVELRYLAEERPLGTAGALGLVEDCDEPLLVMNGDIFTRIDFRSLVEFHRERRAELTVAVRQYDVQVPYGVIETRQGMVCGLLEKPRYEFLVNAGVYVLEPAARRRIPRRRRLDMTDLIQGLIAEGGQVACFPVLEYWLDIGRFDDLRQAQLDARGQVWAA